MLPTTRFCLTVERPFRTSRNATSRPSGPPSVQLLGFSGDKKAIPVVEIALDDPSPAVRAEACRALEDLGAKQSVAALKARMNDLEPGVRQAALEALEALKD